MDKHNRFHTRTTYNLERLDYLVVALILSVLVLARFGQIDWIVFWTVFWVIDVIGTFPAMYWFYARRSGEHRAIPPMFHALYNTTHSFAVIGLAAVLWYLAVGGFRWEMLAMPIHLCLDRSIFGNTYKPLGLSVEPRPHDTYLAFEESYEKAGRW
jgi:hypothetical protein